MKKIILTIGIVAIIAIAIFMNLPQEQQTVKIGFIGPLTGPLANPGVYVKNSFELAHAQYSAVNGREIEVIYEDDKCIPKEAVTAANKLLNVDGVDIVVSSICGGSTLAIAPLTEAQEKILISPISSTPAISEAGDYVFRISSSADLFAERTALMLEESGYERIGIVYENTEYAVGWKDSFVDSFRGEIVSAESFNTGDSDVKTQLLKINEAGPEAILMLVQSPISGALLVKQAKELNIGTQLIGNEGFFSRTVLKNVIGEAAEGLLILTYAYDGGSDAMKEYLKAYEAEFGEKVPEEMHAGLGYDVYMALYDALDGCSDSKCIRDKLYSFEDREGVIGSYSVNAKGDAVRDFMWWIVEEGEIRPLQR
ncbi:ABC transporter substrate-binding protein [Candidatus Woesearchaeota archaeon]|nr:ABC transporter substrate-binding protein [Candidatus Woesearchaeota archaeon]